ncbi:MAG: hypothetical protein DMG73_00090 [Acidobacteria bacterium]|nr:MAG: hypothetical protein DMG73_00090 [Acidobacteriota bacterium]
MNLSACRCEEPEYVLFSGKRCGRIERRCDCLFANTGHERTGEEISARCEKSAERYRFIAQWPGIITVVAGDAQRSDCCALAKSAWQMDIEQMVFAQYQPATQVPRPGVSAAYRQRLILLPTAILEPIDSELVGGQHY